MDSRHVRARDGAQGSRARRSQFKAPYNCFADFSIARVYERFQATSRSLVSLNTTCLSENRTTSLPNTTRTSTNSFALPLPSRIPSSVWRFACDQRLKNDLRHRRMSNRSDSVTPSASEISKTPSYSPSSVIRLPRVMMPYAARCDRPDHTPQHKLGRGQATSIFVAQEPAGASFIWPPMYDRSWPLCANPVNGRDRPTRAVGAPHLALSSRPTQWCHC